MRVANSTCATKKSHIENFQVDNHRTKHENEF